MLPKVPIIFKNASVKSCSKFVVYIFISPRSGARGVQHLTCTGIQKWVHFMTERCQKYQLYRKLLQYSSLQWLILLIFQKVFFLKLYCKDKWDFRTFTRILLNFWWYTWISWWKLIKYSEENKKVWIWLILLILLTIEFSFIINLDYSRTIWMKSSLLPSSKFHSRSLTEYIILCRGISSSKFRSRSLTEYIVLCRGLSDADDEIIMLWDLLPYYMGCEVVFNNLGALLCPTENLPKVIHTPTSTGIGISI